VVGGLDEDERSPRRPDDLVALQDGDGRGGQHVGVVGVPHEVHLAEPDAAREGRQQHRARVAVAGAGRKRPQRHREPEAVLAVAHLG
jgi:hypothetical protein